MAARRDRLTTADLIDQPRGVPPGFTRRMPITEFLVMDDLTRRRGFREGYGGDFLYQAAIPAPGLNRRGFNRGDFLILPEGRGGNAAGAAYPRGILINPRNSFTHRIPTDLIERAILAASGVFEIFIEQRHLERDAHYYVGRALRAIDLSDVALADGRS